MRAPSGGAAYFAIAGQTELSIRLRTPQVLRGTFGPTPPVTTVHLAVDEPERLARALDARAARYAEAPGSGGAPAAPEPAARGAMMLPEASARRLRLLSRLLFVAVPVSQKGGD